MPIWIPIRVAEHGTRKVRVRDHLGLNPVRFKLLQPMPELMPTMWEVHDRKSPEAHVFFAGNWREALVTAEAHIEEVQGSVRRSHP